MKKVIAIILVGVLIVLSGCMSDEADHEPAVVSLYDNLVYDYDSMSFTNTSESDILYSNNNQYLDYIYVYNLLMDDELTTEETNAYQGLFQALDSIVENSNVIITDILTYSSSEFNDAAEESQIVLGLEDIVIFNTLKLKVIELEELSDSSRVVITKVKYIEYILDKDLTSDEIDSLEYLQVMYGELYGKTFTVFDIGKNTLDDLLVSLNERLHFTPTESELIELEIGYNIILDLINE